MGQPLDKRQQISDWSKRPLTIAQEEYAILDAHVLIKIYDAVYDKVREDDKALTALSHIESRLLKNGNKVICVGKDDGKGRNKSETDEEEKVVSPKKYPPCEPPNLRVCCDNMLEGLSKQLRKLGVDSISITAQDSWERYFCNVHKPFDIWCGFGSFQVLRYFANGRRTLKSEIYKFLDFCT